MSDRVMEALKLLLKGVTTMQGAAECGVYSNYCTGICSIFEAWGCDQDISVYIRNQMFQEFRDALRESYSNWPEWSGSRPYPIPGAKDAYKYHAVNRSLWKGKQLRYRRELLRLMASQIRTRIELIAATKRTELVHSLVMAMIQALDDAGPYSDLPPFPWLWEEEDDNGHYLYGGICQQAEAWIDRNVGDTQERAQVNQVWVEAYRLSAVEFCEKHWEKDLAYLAAGKHYPFPFSYPINPGGADEFNDHWEGQTFWRGEQRALRRELIGMIEARLAAKLKE